MMGGFLFGALGGFAVGLAFVYLSIWRRRS